MLKPLALALLSSSLLVPSAAQAKSCSRDLARRTFPGRAWSSAAPTALGWSAEGLDAAMARGARAFSAGMVVHKGQVIGTFGNVSSPFETRSMRKAFLGAVIGQLVAEGKLRLDMSLAELGVDDVTPLSAVEKSATLRDLLTSRSGIYLPAAYVVPGDADSVPPRGTHRPGEAFYYWNWGFNALGGIVEKRTGKTVFNLFDRRIAKPLGLQDFDPKVHGRYVVEPVSRYPAYLFDMSTRDRARFGLLYLNRGCWRGRQLIDPSWIRDSVAPVTNQDKDFDYGYLWWSDEPPPGSGLRQRIFLARGFANQYIVGIPEIETLVVLSVDMSNGQEKLRQGLRPPTRRDYRETLDLVLAARPGARRPVR
jgi:CubicO group peptidase (beta-lactamase class C family)